MAAGVPIVFATDAGVFRTDSMRPIPHHGGAGHDTDTGHPIRHHDGLALHGLGQEVGTIDEGKFGDVIAVKGDPLKDISVLQNVEVVVKGRLLFKMSMAE